MHIVFKSLNVNIKNKRNVSFEFLTLHKITKVQLRI
jgi:hypothetical protein